MFQFPSNGKVEPKEYAAHTPDSVASSFNSLQTGKWSQSNTHLGIFGTDSAGSVSIPFKRESGAKDGKNDIVIEFISNAFQFPSNGKVEPKN